MSMRILRARDVMEKCGFKRTTLWRLTKDNDFPEPIQITNKTIGWREDQVDDWIRARTPVSTAAGQ